jgi:hypothetical protein
MDLTDEELTEVHSVIYDEVYYGEDEVVYKTTERGTLINERLSSALEKVESEAKNRKLWWAK